MNMMEAAAMQNEHIWIASLHELPPGSMIYRLIEGLPIALANVAGSIYAFGDTCRHEGGPLSSGVLIDHTVTCPWHGWTYDIRSGKSIVPPVGLRIPTYALHIEGDDIFIHIEWS
jgi:nitrite reductase/ring-hydroxylating ferredoxin subunit